MSPVTRKADGLPTVRCLQSDRQHLYFTTHVMRDWQSLTDKAFVTTGCSPESAMSRCTPVAIWKAASYDRMCLRRWLYSGLRLAKQSSNTMGVGLRTCCLSSLCVQHCPKCDALMKRSGPSMSHSGHGIEVACVHLLLQHDNMHPIFRCWCDWDFQDHPLSGIFPLLLELHHLLQPQLGPYSFETHLDSYSIKHAYSIP